MHPGHGAVDAPERSHIAPCVDEPVDDFFFSRCGSFVLHVQNIVNICSPVKTGRPMMPAACSLEPVLDRGVQVDYIAA